MSKPANIDAVVNYVGKLRKYVESQTLKTANKIDGFEISVDQLNQKVIDFNDRLEAQAETLEKLRLQLSMLNSLTDTVQELVTLIEGVDPKTDDPNDLGEPGFASRLRQMELRTDIIEEIRGDQRLTARALIQYAGYVNQLVSIAMSDQEQTVEEYKRLGWKVKAMSRMERRTRTDYASILKKSMQARRKQLKESGSRQKALMPSKHPRNSYFSKSGRSRKSEPPTRRGNDKSAPDEPKN